MTLGRLGFAMSLVMTLVVWVLAGYVFPELSDYPRYIPSYFWTTWILLAVLFEIAVVLRLRDLGRSAWWSLPAWFVYPVAAYLSDLAQEQSPLGPTMGTLSWELHWIYAAGFVVVVPLSMLVLLVAPGQKRRHTLRPGLEA